MDWSVANCHGCYQAFRIGYERSDRPGRRITVECPLCGSTEKAVLETDSEQDILVVAEETATESPARSRGIVMSQADAVWNIKRTKHLVLYLEPEQYSEDAAWALLSWINSRALDLYPASILKQQLELFQRRMEGALTPVALSAAHGISPLLMSVPAMFLRYSGYLRFSLGPIDVGVDVFRPAAELGIAVADGHMAMEVFLVESRTADTGPLIGHLAEELSGDHTLMYMFGGGTSYLSGFVTTFRNEARAPSLDQFLWPLILAPQLSLSDADLAALPCYRATRLKGGSLVHVFQDLETGQEADYEAVAARLGLRSVGEFKLV